ncbi:MAG: hypothetical protein WBV82_21815 [Myxococcaceae bacterium]
MLRSSMGPGAFILAALIASIDVTGSTTCPAPAEVAARVDVLAPELASRVGGVHATLEPVPDGVRILLRRTDGTHAGARQLTGAGHCGELADAAAVLVLSWARQLDAEAGDAQAPPEQSLPAQDLPGETPRAREEAPAPRDTSIVVDLAAGLSASLAGGDVAIGGRGFGALTSREHGLGGTLGLAALGVRSSGSGATTWERFALSAGPHYRFTRGPVRIDLHADLVAGLLSVVDDEKGSGASFDPGVSGGVRVLGPAGLWGGVQGTAWPRSPMPRFEVLLSAGLSWTSG